MRKHPKALCEQCPLQNTGEYVQSTGPRESEIAIVGETPGFTEAKTGQPFVGPSGKLLNSVLKHHQINREELFITNAVSCRSANNDTPTKAAISACRPRLIAELKERKVVQVLALGNTATESLTGHSGITKLRIGTGRKCVDLPGIRIVPSFHPAAVLRQTDNFGHLVTDVGKLVLPMPQAWVAPKFVAVETEVLALSLLAQLTALAPSRIIIDIESHIDKDTDFGQAHQLGLLCVGIAYAKDKVVIIGEYALNYPTVTKALATFINGTKEVGYQNGKFDVKGLFPHCGKVKMTLDTMLMSYALDEHPGIHSLEFMGCEYLGAPDWKHDLDKYKPKKNGYGVIPRPVLYKYNAYDCSITYDLSYLLEKRMDEIDVRKVHDFLVEIAEELIYIEMNGMGVDIEYLDILATDYKEKLKQTERKLNLMLPIDDKHYDPTGGLNPNSPKQLKEAFKDFGAIVQSTDVDTCQLIIDRKTADSPVGAFATTLLEHRGVQKEYGTYVEGIRKRLYGDRVYTNFLLHGTTNGRLSSRNPNFQNIPRRRALRRLFIPTRPGNVFIEGDYSQAELRILAWLARDTYFTRIFNEGKRDVFNELSEEVLFPQYPKDSTDEEFYKDLRVRVKAYVYGLAYGRTEYGIAPDIGITVSEARQDIRKFFAVIPEIVTWQKWVKEQVENGNDLISPFGRHRRFSLITDDNHDDVMREALSFLPSSTSSDVCLRAMCRVRQDTKGIAWVRNVVHDSILVECNKSEVDSVIEIMEKRMLESGQELVGDYIKFAVEFKVGKSWGDLGD